MDSSSDHSVDTERDHNTARGREGILNMLVEQLPAVLWTTDRDLCFTSSVGAGLEQLGLKPGQVVGMSLYEYFGTSDPNYESIAMHRRVLEGESVSYDTEWEGRIFQTHVEPLRNDKSEVIGCLGIAMDITKRKTMEVGLERSEQQLRALASRLQAVREEESTNIAREIHDELGQTLTSLKMDLSWIRRRISNHEPSEECLQIVERLASMSEDVDRTIRAVRRISTQLRPVILDDLGLIKALEWQAREFENRTGIICHFRAETAGKKLDADRSTAIFRIFQEILTNVARHAQAQRVRTRLSDENGLLVLDVLDDGRGIRDTEISSPRALGILGMRERAQVCGGRLVIGRDNGRGTRVTVEIPME